MQQSRTEHTSALVKADHIDTFFMHTEKQRSGIAFCAGQIGNRGLRAHSAMLVIAHQLRHKRKKCRRILSHTGYTHQFSGRRLQHGTERTEPPNKRMRQRVDVLLRDSKHEQQFQHLMLGESGKPLFQESLAQPGSMPRVNRLFAHVDLLREKRLGLCPDPARESCSLDPDYAVASR